MNFVDGPGRGRYLLAIHKRAMLAVLVCLDHSYVCHGYRAIICQPTLSHLALVVSMIITRSRLLSRGGGAHTEQHAAYEVDMGT